MLFGLSWIPSVADGWKCGNKRSIAIPVHGEDGLPRGLAEDHVNIIENRAIVQ